MKIKKGDKVQITAGKDKGKKGKVLQVLPEDNALVIEGLNLLIKHMRPRKQGEKGQKIQFPAPLNISNARLICPKCNKLTRAGFKILGKDSGSAGEKKVKKNKKVRICKKCNEVID